MGYKNVGSKLDISKEDFYNEMVKSKKLDELTPLTVKYFIKMATHGVRHGNLNYPDSRDEEDCIQSALHDMIKYWKNFDENIYKDPFAFFTSIVFNGYAKQFKNIYKHRFIKYTKLFTINYNKKPDPDKIIDEIDNIYFLVCSEIQEKDIKRIQIRFKNDKSTKWQSMKMDDLDFLGDICKEFNFIKTIELKVDYVSGVSFIALNQSGDSEIYSI